MLLWYHLFSNLLLLKCTCELYVQYQQHQFHSILILWKKLKDSITLDGRAALECWSNLARVYPHLLNSFAFWIIYTLLCELCSHVSYMEYWGKPGLANQEIPKDVLVVLSVLQPTLATVWKIKIQTVKFWE